MFQKIVISKYLKTQNKDQLIKQWDLFCAHFKDPQIQENIRNSKEEQYQEGFFRDLFVNILGYTLNPTIGFNLTTEYKNIKDSKKADGAIVIDANVVGVIELKGTNTTDLGKVEEQAFNYKNNQTGCTYVITSNFEKLRLYIDDSVTFVEYNLFTLTKDDFDLLYLLLSCENVKNNIPKKIKDESLNQEDIVTKKLYKDYSVFKRELFQNLILLNPDHDPLKLFQKSQKLLDRLLFLFFGEDRGLLPPNSVRQILEQWDKLKELDAYDPLYNRYKKYFGYLNTGFKGKNHDVFAYNGGLFKDDEILDHIKIDDDLLYKHTFRLSQYDFASEIDVNILGHIFENSLNEIDEVKAQLDGTEVDKSKTKRKKDGVFYTPKYITKYIVENTVGKLCDEKKAEYGILEGDYFTDRKRQQKTKENLLAKLERYRKWLLQITIVDPACGSGAFLNEALNFLIIEHQYIDELEAKLLNVPIIFSYHSESILEHNLFGVDLNEESVEIAKLSLWLRTAEPNRKLNSLNNNIKCGNSLIDDPEIAGDKAFNWEHEFPIVFAKGGFDVIVGNPPYVHSHSLDQKSKDYIYLKFRSAEYQINTYSIFTEQIIKILNHRGIYSIIIPNYWLSTKYDEKFRRLVFLENQCLELVNVFQVFEDAVVDTVILTGQKSNDSIFPKQTNLFSVDKSLHSIEKRLVSLYERKWSFSQIAVFKDQNSQIKISFNYRILLKGDNKISDYLDGFQGMKPYEFGKGSPSQTREMMNNRIYNSSSKTDSDYLPLLGAANVQRYLIREDQSFIKYGSNLAAPRKIKIFSQPRILLNRILSKNHIDASYEEETLINNTDVFNFLPKDNYEKFLMPILAIINSKLCAYHFKSSNINIDRKVFPKLNVNNILEFPIPTSINDISSSFVTHVDSIISQNKKLQNVIRKSQRSFQREFLLEKLSNKLKNWHNISYAEFLHELKKQKVQLSLSQKADWETYFEQEKETAAQIESKINETDQEIDRMVYELYGLTPAEIEIVEKN